MLRKMARPVESVNSPDVQALIDGLIETLTVSNGVGIAAPQVGVSLRLFVIAPGPDPSRPDVPEAGPVAIINPEITGHSPEIVKDWEGCLSIPGIRGLVPRFRSVALRYQRRDGVSEEAEFTDFIARICQHEYDHLEGLVYLDRMDGVKDIISDDYYRMLM